MCRIAGLVTNRLQVDEVKRAVKVMCEALQHGGPDDEGLFYSADANVTFGHRRLSIIDLSKRGHQPMADQNLKAWITFNGEIYNYNELKTQLQQLGATFNSDTDTEVIIQAYLHWGTNSFSKLRGMFAFALYDTISGAVYLVRDSTGIKPLYYYATEGQISFASEIRAFKAAGLATDEDTRWPVWLLAFGHIPEPYTTLKNVLSIPKGHFLCWNKNGAHTIEKYQQTAITDCITDIQSAREGINHYLKKAVIRQLIADAPIGVFLSGGIDSSLLTLLAAQKKQDLKTISIFFNEKEYDERAYQHAVLDKLSGSNFTHLVKQHDFETHLPKILGAMDMPTTDGINSWFISKYAREDGLKTVLSGIGADELFGGYPSFDRIKYLRYLKMLPAAPFTLSKLFSDDRVKKFGYLKQDNTAADYLFLRGLYAPVDIAKLIDMDEDEVNSTLFDDLDIPALDKYDKLNAAWLETNMYMQNQLLHDTDIMSMSHGLEVRVPFLNEDFQQYVSQIHPSIRFHGNQPKKILIDAFEGLVPEVVWNRPKMGFTFPLQKWMAANESISNKNNYKGTAAKKIINKFNKGKIHWSRAFALYQVQGHV
ncbi:asparagine synthase (glutamine-hydrolyzing) [Mucilaginibacter terrigena]|uniref:asparagine synthase (glutamine-hydrolyzing) n=1 Tax=Mucilaginibacter terrigena TaxID=2492395 RepID=A0A4Q5LQA1_9SPHI|nr:asparagine synthase (glutamine-hydrolyzing) [Mucilaginibacter terrigena]RYU91628.1 asparagine synthase (glutamine-hydrolyzing) [Mucilaginibacter terrigena]